MSEDIRTTLLQEPTLATGSSEMKKLPPEFYRRSDVITITRDLIGKLVVTTFDGLTTSGRIVEAEAYNGPHDKAAHSYNNRRTNRTEVMFAEGGVAYVYLCYGIHQMFNIVTNQKDIPNAILIRALEPVAGIDTMLLRSDKITHGYDLTRGPGNVAKALGIYTRHSGMSLQGNEIFIADDGTTYSDDEIAITPRIGVDYAGEDALLPYRFILKSSKYLSGKCSLNAGK
ncbi:DNA-3-methyladenine glycosylase [Aridibaculum aurantiacum]|uniref:DNA-3-methyladenine glycosylase n=1 Tax=Aridibaculum aurantiacum TaxID=2810307 RepID=UPI001F6109E4|nr:DNA-3-methyladenine glycosylase [Aridibaculum aurantiacum]